MQPSDVWCSTVLPWSSFDECTKIDIYPVVLCVLKGILAAKAAEGHYFVVHALADWLKSSLPNDNPAIVREPVHAASCVYIN